MNIALTKLRPVSDIICEVPSDSKRGFQTKITTYYGYISSLYNIHMITIVNTIDNELQ